MKKFETSKDNYLNLLKESTKVKIHIKHEGVLEVPEGKEIEDLPISHFKNLVKKKGFSTISKALTNLIVWNKNKRPIFSKKIDTIQNNLTSWVDRERKKSNNENLYEK